MNNPALTGLSLNVGPIAEKARQASDVLSNLAMAVEGDGAAAGAGASAGSGQQAAGQKSDGLGSFFEGLLTDLTSGLKDTLSDTVDGLLDNLVSGIFDKKEEKDSEEDNKSKQAKGANGEADNPIAKLLGDKLGGLLSGLKEKFQGLLSGLGDKLKGVLGGLTDKLGGMFKGLLSNLGGLFQGGSLGGIGALFSSVGSLFGFAGGGRVQAGVPAVVGERGPELIVPSRASTVMNAADSKSASGGNPVAVNQTVNFDLVPSPTINAMIDAKKPEIEQAAIQGTLRALNRGAGA